MRTFVRLIAVVSAFLIGGLALQSVPASAEAAQVADFRIVVDQAGKVTVTEREGTTQSASGAEGAALLAGCLGTCYPDPWTSTRGGGWCDGNGPDARYNGLVRCTGESFERTGPQRWAGDRNKSYAYCPSGRTNVYGGVDGYYV